ncbi:MAG: hypothetical protein EP315_04665 [Gammaproteobacteria bacterium]|nr:MAG: hypothetical protein EP315_04665 [Gammaproteobacteria bacterium]
MEFAETVTTEAGTQLHLNGLGIRNKFVFRIYIAALYLQQPSRDVDTILSGIGHKRIIMHFLYDEISREKLIAAWNEGFENNLELQELQSLQPAIQAFNNAFETLRYNDVVQIDFMPSLRTRVRINGEDKGLIREPDFFPALLKIWLGRNPISDDLKDALLGQD